ncbi:MAG TPA: SGNH/GDSL hydrolase family protein [Flavisolibacter sp.]|jgi:lysophospholipase L1-like esterase|nr:SGNH/GDSL hydrolase family protein [Flavisolibacter sp.]
MSNTSRRNFISFSAIAATTAVLKPWDVLAGSNSPDRSLINNNLVFLFQGDSITDGNRGRNTDPNHIMGHGYAFAVSSHIAADFAENNFTFYNRGISGNKLPDLQKRWEADALALKPDVLSILIGINDVHVLVNKTETAQSAEEFESGYRGILQRSKTAKPNILFVLGLPFVYPVANVKDKWEMWFGEVEKRKAIIKKLAKEFDAVLVDYPSVFNEAIKRRSVDYWIWDGIHPTIGGHELMAREWIKQVSARMRFLRRIK